MAEIKEIPKEALPKLWRDMRWCPLGEGHYTPYLTCPIHSVETLTVRMYVEPK